MARPRAHSGADGPKEPHSVSLKGKYYYRYTCISSNRLIVRSFTVSVFKTYIMIMSDGHVLWLVDYRDLHYHINIHWHEKIRGYHQKHLSHIPPTILILILFLVLMYAVLHDVIPFMIPGMADSYRSLSHQPSAQPT